MKRNEPEVGDKVHHEGRKHPSKKDWLDANGTIINVLVDEDDDDLPVQEVMVEYSEGVLEFYSVDELEWTPFLCDGYWRVSDGR
jgi:hypothetical protein